MAEETTTSYFIWCEIKDKKYIYILFFYVFLFDLITFLYVSKYI